MEEEQKLASANAPEKSGDNMELLRLQQENEMLKRQKTEELESLNRKIKELNEENAKRRIENKAKTELEIKLESEIETFKRQLHERENNLTSLKSEMEKKQTVLESYQKEYESEKKEQLEYAKLVSEKLNNPDVVAIAENISDNKARKKFLDTYKLNKVDTYKGAVGFHTSDEPTKLFSAEKGFVKFTDAAKLYAENPELYLAEIEKLPYPVGVKKS